MHPDELLARYENSADWRERLAFITPGGAQTMSKRPSAFGTMAYPAAIERGDRGRVRCVDGHEYVDLILGLAAIGIGYNDETINGAVHRQVERGASFSLPTRLECQVAERLVSTIPCADMVRFVKTGSEACQAAVRIARRATGRDLVLVCGYHGWHDWYAASKPVHPGVPDRLSELVFPFEYNALDSFTRVLERAEGYVPLEKETSIGVAAVIMEPTLFEEPRYPFLQEIRRLCSEKGIVLIFDEMVTGFRWSERGYQAQCEVTPDLATFGKAMANGYPLACVVGKRALMEHGDVISGTFGGEAIALAACEATLDVYEEEDICYSIRTAGRRFYRAFEEALRGANLPAKMVGSVYHPRIDFDTGDADLDRQAIALFVQTMAAEGVLIHPAGWNVCADQDNDDDVHVVQHAAEIAAHTVRDALAGGVGNTIADNLIGGAPSSGVRA